MRTTRVVCAVDGSSYSKRALTFALEEAEARGVPFTVVIARPTLSARWSGDVRLAEPVRLAEAEDLQKHAQGLLDEAVRLRGRSAGVATAVEVLNGPPAEVIEDYLQPTDLLVIGSRGIGGVRRLLLGSVSCHNVWIARVSTSLAHARTRSPGRRRRTKLFLRERPETTSRWLVRLSWRSLAPSPPVASHHSARFVGGADLHWYTCTSATLMRERLGVEGP